MKISNINGEKSLLEIKKKQYAHEQKKRKEKKIENTELNNTSISSLGGHKLKSHCGGYLNGPTETAS